MNKRLIVIICCLFMVVLVFFALTYTPTRADSGWDTSYDGGSSGGGGGSSFDFDFGSGSSSRDRSRSNHKFSFNWPTKTKEREKREYTKWEMTKIMIGLACAPILLYLLCLMLVKTAGHISKKNYNARVNKAPKPEEINENELKYQGEKKIQELLSIKPDFDLFKFYQKAYEIYLEVQKDWMNFNYDGLRSNLTDELYNTYKMQLKALDAQNGQNIMNSFDLQEIYLYDFNIDEANKVFSINVILKVSFIDYVINEHGEITRGTNKRKVNMTYMITYVEESIENHDNCPNCGNPLEDKASQTCPYCNSTIVHKKHDFTMSKKQALMQK